MVKFGKFSSVKRLRCCVFGAAWTSPSSLPTIPNLSKYICVLHNDAATKGYLNNKMHHDAVFWYVWKNLVFLLLLLLFFFPPPPPTPFPFRLANVWTPHVLLLRVSSQRCIYFSLSVCCKTDVRLTKDAMVFLGGCGLQHSCHILALFC